CAQRQPSQHICSLSRYSGGGLGWGSYTRTVEDPHSASPPEHREKGNAPFEWTAATMTLSSPRPRVASAPLPSSSAVSPLSSSPARGSSPPFRFAACPPRRSPPLPHRIVRM